MNIVMGNEIQCLDLVIRKMSNDPSPQVSPPRYEHPTPLVLSPGEGNPGASNPPLPNIEVDVEDVVRVPDVQSGPNQVGINLDIPTFPQEIPLSQEHPSKWLSNTFVSILTSTINPMIHTNLFLFMCLNCRGDPG